MIGIAQQSGDDILVIGKAYILAGLAHRYAIIGHDRRGMRGKGGFEGIR
jgi:hypothetical protein